MSEKTEAAVDCQRRLHQFQLQLALQMETIRSNRPTDINRFIDETFEILSHAYALVGNAEYTLTNLVRDYDLLEMQIPQ